MNFMNERYRSPGDEKSMGRAKMLYKKAARTFLGQPFCRSNDGVLCAAQLNSKYIIIGPGAKTIEHDMIAGMHRF